MEKQRCEATIYKRDTYRRTGRGRTGFEMHYNRECCKKPARDGGLCSQHLAISLRRPVDRYADRWPILASHPTPPMFAAGWKLVTDL